MNPVTHARYLSTLSTTALAKKLHVSRQYISRLEQGLYDKPNEAVLSWTTDILNNNLASDSQTNVAEVEKYYRAWQWQHRELTKDSLFLKPLEVTKYDKVIQSEGVIWYYRLFKQWRSDYWNTAHTFCVDMCLHPGPVVDYEDGKTSKMPGTLKEVLNHLGLLGQNFKTGER
jgi:Helix-turn-helix.